MSKKTDNNQIDKKLDRIVSLLEALLALELNRTNLDRNEIRARLGVDKAVVNKILNGIKKKGE